MPLAPAPAPKVSVVIAAYNWSGALRCALTSVLRQTLQDFEVLVVGDHCTDDSGAVVESFGDPRLNWRNLPVNTGGQSGPNNAGIEEARAPIIAFLGQDDIWWPTHLEAVVARMEADGLDGVASGCLLYGPPGSGVHALSGVFATGLYTPDKFVPPSSFAYTRELARRVGPWAPPRSTPLPVDYDVLVRCHEAGARIGATGELTVFKMPAAWRKNSYRLKPVDEQEALLRRMVEGPDFRHLELMKLMQSVVDGRLHDIDPNLSALRKRPAGERYATTRRLRGVDQAAPAARRLESEPVRFQVREDWEGLEWHPAQSHPKYGRFRWSGPLPTAEMEFPIRLGPCDVTLCIVGTVLPEIYDMLEVTVNGAPLALRVIETEGRMRVLRGRHLPQQEADGPAVLRFSVDRVLRPCDFGLGNSKGWVGVAFAWVEFRPVADGLIGAGPGSLG